MAYSSWADDANFSWFGSQQLGVLTVVSIFSTVTIISWLTSGALRSGWSELVKIKGGMEKVYFLGVLIVKKVIKMTKKFIGFIKELF